MLMGVALGEGVVALRHGNVLGLEVVALDDDVGRPLGRVLLGTWQVPIAQRISSRLL